jgi:hypothetical protein
VLGACNLTLRQSSYDLHFEPIAGQTTAAMAHQTYATKLSL